MAKPLVTDELWALVEPLLPPEPPKPEGGQPRIDNRAVLTGILFVLRSGIPWEMLPREMGCRSGMTCRRRLRDWQQWHHPLLAIRQSGANPHDSRMLEEMVDAVPALRGRRGRPRQRPTKRHADMGYDFPRCRQALRKRGILPRIARKGIESSERLGRHRWVAIAGSPSLGRHRWVMERTLSWHNRFHRLRVRDERRVDIHQAFLNLACAVICFRFLQRIQFC